MHASFPFSSPVSRFLARVALAGAALAGASAVAQTNYIPYAITTLAGSPGGNGFVNDTGSAARFSYPSGVAVDAQGNVYVADGSNHAVRKVTSAGVVTTLATSVTSGTGSGTNFGVLGGIAIDSAGQDLYVTDYSSGAVYKITLAGTATLFLPGGTMSNPDGIALDSAGNVYVADSGNAVIREITPAGAISVLAGKVGNSGFANGTGTAAQFAFPIGVAVDGSGNLYVADASIDVIRKIVIQTGLVSTFAGQPTDIGTVDGSLGSALFNTPTGIAIDSSGNLYLTDSRQMVREITAGGTVTSLAGSTTRGGSTDGTGSSALFSFSYPTPAGIAVDASGNIYVADTGNDTVRKGTLSAAVPPAITTQPQNQTVAAGSSATFSVVVTGTGPFTYQWNVGGGAILPATASSYTIPSVKSSDAGTYQVIVTGPGGTAFSAYATLTVTASGSGPSISVQPQTQTDATGSNPVLSVTALGTGLTYQWYLNGSPIAGATGSSLTLSNLAATAAGSYTVTVTDASGNTVTSGAATVGVATSARLINLSILSNIQGSLSMGFVIGGSGTSGPENLLIRGVGPSIGPGTAFNVPGVIFDPTLTVVQQSPQTTIVTDAGWGTPANNVAAVESADAATGAFPLTDPTSLDSAVVTSLPAVTGGYSATVAGASGDNGYALTEVYDNTGSAYTPASTRLINLSCLTQIAAGSSLNVGFVIGGTSSETVLVRAWGPTLAAAPFSLGGTMADPQLSVSPSGSLSTVLAANAGWGGNASLAAAAAAVGAYAFVSTASKDSAALATLPPGVYNVQVNSVSGAGGTVLVEVYEVR